MTPLFGGEKSLAELEEKEELLKQKRRVLNEEVAIQQLEQQMGRGGWRKFSSDGTKKGIDFHRIWAWLNSKG